MRTKEIMQLVYDIKKEWNTNDPFIIADRFGIKVIVRPSNIKDFKAQIIKVEGYPSIISINSKFSETSQKVLCAHELGHGLLHSEAVNHFAVTTKNMKTNVEYEANLFAVTLLCEEEEFSIPISQMNNTLLKSILDYNIYT